MVVTFAVHVSAPVRAGHPDPSGPWSPPPGAQWWINYFPLCEGDPRGGASFGSDRDGDGREDDADNCPFAANPDQLDSDGDSWGDVCDTSPLRANQDQGADRDGDGVADRIDNCPDRPNQDQKDSDRDGLGDSCDDRYCLAIRARLLWAIGGGRCPGRGPVPFPQVSGDRGGDGALPPMTAGRSSTDGG
jgi:hypothetical protein